MIKCADMYSRFPDAVKDFVSRINGLLSHRNVIIIIPESVLVSVNACRASGNETFPIAIEVKAIDSEVTFDHLLRTKSIKTLTEIALLISLQQGVWRNRWPHFSIQIEPIGQFFETICSDAYKLFDPDNQVVDIPSELKHCIDLIELTAKAEGKPFGYIATIIPG